MPPKPKPKPAPKTKPLAPDRKDRFMWKAGDVSIVSPPTNARRKTPPAK